MLKNTWIDLTNQNWKINVGLILAFIICIFFGFSILHLKKSDNLFVINLLLGVVSSILCLFWFMLAIRCPVCKGKIVWNVMSQHGFSVWFIVLLRLDHCPICNSLIKN